MSKKTDEVTKLMSQIDDLQNQLEDSNTKLKESNSNLKKANTEIRKLKRKAPAETKLHYESKLQSVHAENLSLRRDLKAAVRKHGIFQALAEELEALVVPFDALPTKLPKVDTASEEEHFVVHLSDEHADEIVLPHQVGGLEEFNFNVALTRAETYVDEILAWKAKLDSNIKFPVLHILSYGDHTSGQIHGAKERSEYKNMLKNSLAIGQMQALMFRDLAPHFEDVKVYCVSGNHGRMTAKKDFHGAHDNFDYLISEIARLQCSDIPNIEFCIPDSWSMRININGWGFGLEHGDSVKSWMGIPYYGLERKTRRLTALHSATNSEVRIDYYVFGHFHALSTSADLKGEMIINGAWPATNPYGFEEFSGYREPMQMIHGVSQAKGVSWRNPIKLKNPDRERLGPQRYKVDLIDGAKTEI